MRSSCLGFSMEHFQREPRCQHNVGTSERMAWIGLIARKTTSILIIFSLQKVSLEHSKIPSRLARSRMEKASPLVRNASTAESSGIGAGEVDAAVGLVAPVPMPGLPPEASPRPGGSSEVPPHTAAGEVTVRTSPSLN